MIISIIVGAIVAVGTYFMGRNDGKNQAYNEMFGAEDCACPECLVMTPAPVETKAVEVTPAVVATPVVAEAKPKQVKVTVTVAKVAKTASKKSTTPAKKATKKSK